MMDHLFWHGPWKVASDNLPQLKDELKSVEKQINKMQWRGKRNVPGHLHSRRAYLRGEIAKLEAR